MLDSQIFIYSVDTSSFDSDEERSVEIEISMAKHEKTLMKRRRDILKDYYAGDRSEASYSKALREMNKIDRGRYTELPDKETISEYYEEIADLNKRIKDNKDKLDTLFDKSDGRRSLRPEDINRSKIISIFESTLTRAIGVRTNQLTEDIVIVRVLYYKVFKNLVLNGFDYKGEHYVCFTASAGQIRTKKCVFIKESIWAKVEPSITCGLSLDKINAQGGCNTNKYLAYLALCNSATDPWDDFDIDKCIVVEDYESLVRSEVDYIDPSTYEIERKTVDIPICHTDGCGMMLASIYNGNVMVRLPWIKGLLTYFPYDKFVREARRRGNKECGKVRDIYGKTYDIFADDIEVIFTKSQFKMWKFYSSWDEYKEAYKSLHCSAGKCNEEPKRFDNAKINYQMLQSLSDITDDELRLLAKQNNYYLATLSTEKSSMLKVFGATESNLNKTALQEALLLYPPLVRDSYCRETLRDRKRAMEEDSWCGKLNLHGKYTFVVPDMYAFCENLFLGYKDADGLLKNGEVYCDLFKNQELDCLRSPSLYREHAVRTNICGTDGELRRWYKTRAIYTSVHDCVSKILMFDCDGDKLLVCAEPTLVRVAKRNMQDVVPLYYPMAKAGAHTIDNEAIYKGMVTAYTGTNIGVISNYITKAWNSADPDIEVVKLLTMEANFSVDYAKTLFKPVRPDNVDEQIKRYTKPKVPYFFKWVKDKNSEQVEPINNSVINRLHDIIPVRKLDYHFAGIDKFDYHTLMHSPMNAPVNGVQECGDKFVEIVKSFVGYNSSPTLYTVDDKDVKEEYGADNYANMLIRQMMLEDGSDIYEVVDKLIVYYFGSYRTKRKASLWRVFGDVICDNIRANHNKYKHCKVCGKLCISNERGLCKACVSNAGLVDKVCTVCGKHFVAKSKGRNQTRCPECQAEHRRKLHTENVRKIRSQM